ncbi:MAG TPA: hypothetical protein VF511_05945 [Chthoniobacterales bacterium]
MKRLTSSRRCNASGFTLSEIMVTLGMASVVGVCATYIFLNGTILIAKNTAENVAHDQNRIAINRLLHDIHAAISTPQLGHIVTGKLAQNPTAPNGSWTPYGTNLTFWADSGTGPAAGVSFKKMGNAFNANGGPFELKNDPGNPELVMVKSYSTAPLEGMEIVFPYYTETIYDSSLKKNITRPMEGTIYKVTSNGSDHYNIFIQGGLENRIKEKKGTHVICYYMSRFAYVVENGNLNFYSTSQPPAGVTWPVTIARNIVNEADRTLPAKPFSQATTDYVGINLTTEDNRYSNRKFKAVNTLLAGTVPIRAKLSVTQ